MNESKEMKIIPKRSEIKIEDTWAVEDLYKSDEAWKEDYNKTKELPKEISEYKGKLGESGASLYEYLKFMDEVQCIVERLAHYAMRKSDEDTGLSTYQEMKGQFMSLNVAINSATSFDTPEILEIPEETLEGFYKAEPKLELYRNHLINIRRKKNHILSLEEEKIMAQAGEMAQTATTVYSMFNNADAIFENAIDSKGNPHQITQGSYISLLESEDRVLRESAFKSYYKTYGNYKNTLAATLDGQVKKLMFNANVRNYDSTLQASLDVTNVPVEVYHNLIKAVNDNMDYMHKYVRLRKKLLKVDELHMYDLYTPVVEEASRPVSYEDAKRNIYEAVAPLGEEYQKLLQEGFDSRWIDVYENVGKRSGAYSAGARVHPFILMNYQDTLNSQFTLAHEMGHGIHSYLSNKTQPVVYSDYVIFVAEVASTCNEALLMQYLLEKTTDKKERAYLINYYLEQFRGTLYRQTMFAEFELAINERAARGEGLTADALSAIYRELNIKYFGEDIIVDEEIDLEWARIPHFYYNYYVFQYATGYSAAIALTKKILEEKEPAVKDYINFLSAGSSKDPISLLKDAGVDMATEAPINDALALFNELIDELDSLLD